MSTIPVARARRGLFGALSLCTLLGCYADTATAPLPSQSGPALSVGTAALSNRFAYALADNPTAASYVPNLKYSFNGTGGGIRITHSPGSAYAVTFGGLGHQGLGGLTETFIVTPYGPTNAHCVAGYYTETGSSITVNVFCIDPTQGIGTDSRFIILAIGNNSLPAHSAFAYANNPFAASYTPDPNFSYTSAGVPINIQHDPVPGSYTVNLGTGKPIDTSILVNSRLTPTQCQLGAFLPTATARIRCFDSFSGPPLDADYQVAQVGAGRPGQRFAFALADKPGTASYNPNPKFSFSSGGAMTATRSSTGHYAVYFTGLQKLTGHTETVQVTPVGGTYANCAVVSWTSPAGTLRVNVECRDIVGNFSDAQFQVTVIE